MLQVKALTKTYGKKRGVKDITFSVADGEILGFLGPNGAGKSTTMNIITGCLASTSGEVFIDGVEILEDPIKAKGMIGYLPEKPPLYMDMTVREYLGFLYELKKVKLPRQKHIEEICNMVGIMHVMDRVIKNLSKGYCQRVGIAQSMLGYPKLLILDEPTVGLDPKQIIEIRELIKSLGKKQTIILSSHILSEIQAVCDRVVVINEGRLIADDTPKHLSQKISAEHKLLLEVKGEEENVCTILRSVPGVLAVESRGPKEDSIREYMVESRQGCDIRADLFFSLAEQKLPLVASRPQEMTLEDIFLMLTQREPKGEEK